MKPSLYATTIRHVRRAPLANTFTYRSYSWFVDLDELPRLPGWLRPFAVFRAEDHLGDPEASIRSNVAGFLTANGIDDDGGTVTMLGSARVLGYVFNPLTLFWCHGRDGGLRAVLAEVHNTYGERHCYLLHPDGSGRAVTPKEFYVSPFNDISGTYEMSVPEPDSKLSVAITLRRPGQPPFAATMAGTRLPATSRNVVRMAAAIPLAPLRATLQIRWQGIRLWLRRLPLHPRPNHKPQEYVR
ncbi:hypothetical protein SAMN04488693_10214 [Arthrobacter subterraneus]|uniref:DUF1365 family protein n=1 Tax=Arthrobacter subterraneus TaxID=335973 RepID=A0A1G8E871_9MICC|nr:DUF1365 domain-containing protein [Arthrobacter subterraneus]SDH66094.1 hypothetical protein SAMN04488693_10214 [Arthrobacter subterraneus]